MATSFAHITPDSTAMSRFRMEDCNTKDGAKIELNNTYRIKFVEDSIHIKDVVAFAFGKFQKVTSYETLSPEQKLVFNAVITHKETPSKVKCNYLMCRNLERGTQIQTLSELPPEDIIELLEHVSAFPESDAFITKLIGCVCSLPPEKLDALSKALVGMYKRTNELPKLFTNAVLRQLLNKLPLPQSHHLHAGLNPLDWQSVLWNPKKITTVRDVQRSNQLMMLLSYMPLDKIIELFNVLPNHLLQPCITVRLMLEQGKVRPPKPVRDIVPPSSDKKSATTVECDFKSTDDDNELFEEVLVVDSLSNQPNGRLTICFPNEKQKESDLKEYNRLKNPKSSLTTALKSRSLDPILSQKLQNSFSDVSEEDMRALIDTSLHDLDFWPLSTLIQLKAECIEKHSAQIAVSCQSQLFKLPIEHFRSFMSIASYRAVTELLKISVEDFQNLPEQHKNVFLELLVENNEYRRMIGDDHEAGRRLKQGIFSKLSVNELFNIFSIFLKIHNWDTCDINDITLTHQLVDIPNVLLSLLIDMLVDSYSKNPTLDWFYSKFFSAFLYQLPPQQFIKFHKVILPKDFLKMTWGLESEKTHEDVLNHPQLSLMLSVFDSDSLKTVFDHAHPQLLKTLLVFRAGIECGYYLPPQSFIRFWPLPRNEFVSLQYLNEALSYEVGNEASNCKAQHEAISAGFTALNKEDIDLIIYSSSKGDQLEPLATLSRLRVRGLAQHSDYIISKLGYKLLELPLGDLEGFLSIATDSALVRLFDYMQPDQIYDLIKAPNPIRPRSPESLTIRRISDLLCSSKTVTDSQQLINGIRAINIDCFVSLILELPGAAVAKVYELQDSSLRDSLFQSITQKLDQASPEVQVRFGNRLLCSSIPESGKRKFLFQMRQNSKGALLILANNLSPSILQEFYRHQEQGARIELLKTVKPHISQTPEVQAQHLNRLPDICMHHLFRKPNDFNLPKAINFFENPHVDDETKFQLTIFVSEDEAIKLLGKRPDLIHTLPSRVVMQFNRKLRWSNWELIAQQLPAKQIHLWTDFLSQDQTDYWKGTQDRLPTKELILLLDSSRLSDYMKLVNKDYVGPCLLNFSTEQAVEVLKKLCTSQFGLEMLILARKVLNSEQQLQKIIAQFKFVLHPEESWPIVRQELYESLSLLSNEGAKLSKEEYRQHSRRASQALASLQDFRYGKVRSKTAKQLYPDEVLKAEVERRESLFSKIKGVDFEAQKHEKLLVHLHSDQKRKSEGKPYLYVTDLTKTYPTLVVPVKRPSEDEQKKMKGAYKKIQCADERTLKFVSVSTENKENFTEKDYIKLRNMLRQLFDDVASNRLKISSITLGLSGILIKKGELVTARGGNNLYNFCQAPVTISLQTFQQCCRDLAIINKLGYYLRDIKCENLLISEETIAPRGHIQRLQHVSLQFIDLHSLCKIPHGKGHISQKYYGSPCGTLHFMPLRLQCLEFEGGGLNRERLKAKDEYALLMTILYATSIDFRKIFNQLRKSLGQKDFVGAITALEQRRNVPRAAEKYLFGILHILETSDREKLKTLINRLILPQYQDIVTRFLKDPHSNPLPLTLSLYDTINWHADLAIK
ncbi:hypothetical protein SOPP22_07295 [Shewanella sp. OPT22]|nr:hypothetical protein SOPP22_07295 [Shewanella sp. OPT22]